MTTSDIISVIIGLLSLLITCVIFYLQSKQDKRVNKQLEYQHKEEVRARIRAFIINHYEELDFLPLCFIAFKYNYHRKYVRKIFNDFNMLNKEEQDELKVELNYEFPELNTKDWFNAGIELVRNFISEHKLGKDWLYDGAKYFKSSLDFASYEFDTRKVLTEPIIKDVFHLSYNFGPACQLYKNGINFSRYLSEYYYRVSLKRDSLALINREVIPPIDALTLIKQLGTTDLDEVCFWVMEIVDQVSMVMISLDENNNDELLDSGDLQVKSYEDKYFLSLMNLYNLVYLNEKKEC